MKITNFLAKCVIFYNQRQLEAVYAEWRQRRVGLDYHTDY